MIRKVKENIKPFIPFIPLILLTIFVIWYRNLLTPFVISAIVAYLLNPFMVLMEKRFSRIFILFIIFFALSIIVVAVAFLLIPFIINEIGILYNSIPSFIEDIKKLSQINFPYKEKIIEKLNSELINFGNVIIANGYNVISSGLTILVNLVTIPIFTFYFLKDKEVITKFMWKFIPKNYEKQTSDFLKKLNARMKGFFKGQFLDFSALAAMLSIGLTIVGVEYSILLALLCATFNLIPYLGMILSFVTIGLVVWFYGHTIGFLLLTLGVFLICQMIESLILAPNLIGSSANVHPLAIVIAIMVGGATFGVAGVIFAIPGLILIDVLIRK